MKATTPAGDLIPMENCYIEIPIAGAIKMKILPEISDSKSASYNDEPIIGRAFPLKTYSHSENRSISWTMHLMTVKDGDTTENLRILRSLEACVYPEEANTGGAPYAPPPICKLKCGNLFGMAPRDTLCAVLKSYNVKFPSDVVWDEQTYLPNKFDIDLQFDVVYESNDLPGRQRIMTSGS